jgi:hypothetical protein
MISSPKAPDPIPTPEPVAEQEISLPNKIMLWLFVVFFFGIGLIVILDLIAGLVVR